MRGPWMRSSHMTLLVARLGGRLLRKASSFSNTSRWAHFTAEGWGGDAGKLLCGRRLHSGFERMFHKLAFDWPCCKQCFSSDDRA